MSNQEIQKMIDAMRDGSPEAESAADTWQAELDAGTAEELGTEDQS